MSLSRGLVKQTLSVKKRRPSLFQVEVLQLFAKNRVHSVSYSNHRGNVVRIEYG